MAASILRRPWKGIRWLWAMGLGLPLLLGLLLVLGIAMSLLTPRRDTSELVQIGSFDSFKVASPVLFEEEGVWIVRRENDEILALYDRDPLSSCRVFWRPSFEFMGRAGWFQDSCLGSIYDVEGRCVEGPCTRGLDRFDVFRQAAAVIVNLADLEPGPPPVSAEGEPAGGS
jgi:nitrite reductase/ring-hydroxylating ferredoxin subunit